MKKHGLFSILVLILSLFYVLPGMSQGTTTLKVVSMPGYPDLPADTAYEGQTYSFEINLKNNTNIIINSASVNIHLQVDSIVTIISSNPALSLLPGDSVLIPVTPYNFTLPQY